MTFTGAMIAFNEEAFIETSIRHAMKFCDRIIVVEGAILKSRMFSLDGRSTDKTIEILMRLKSEFRDRLTVVFRDGFWKCKAEMFAAMNDHMVDGWVMEIDCDEFFHVDAVNRLKKFLTENPEYTQVNVWLNHFFGRFDSMVVRKEGAWGNQFREGIPRFFKSFNGAKWSSHTPPILECDTHRKLLTRDESLKLGLVCFHYGYVWMSQVAVKSQFHAPWQKWNIAAEWTAVKHGLFEGLKTANEYEAFDGDHPINVQDLKEPKLNYMEEDPYIVFIGTGRCGTTYAAKCLTANGLDVGHEKIGKDGIASWDLAFPKLIHQPWTGNLQVPTNSMFIHLVRNPVDCISSLVGIGDKSWEFICRASHNSTQYHPLLRAMMHYILWNTQCAGISKHRVRIEHFEEDMRFLNSFSPLKEGPVNKRNHPKLTLADLRKVSSELTKIITQMGKAYGYE